MNYALLPIAMSLALGGCVAAQTPATRYYDAQRKASLLHSAGLHLEGGAGDATVRTPKAAASPCAVSSSAIAGQDAVVGETQISAGDLVRVTLPGEDSPMGVFKVDHDGVLTVGGMGNLPVVGLTTTQAERDLDRMLEKTQTAHRGSGHAALHLLDSGTDRINWLAQCVTGGNSSPSATANRCFWFKSERVCFGDVGGDSGKQPAFASGSI